MALHITEECTGCDACVPACPNEAIDEGEDLIYVIETERCTECVGAHDDPQCVLVCPADCIDPDPMNFESPADLQAKYQRLHS